MLNILRVKVLDVLGVGVCLLFFFSSFTQQTIQKEDAIQLSLGDSLLQKGNFKQAGLLFKTVLAEAQKKKNRILIGKAYAGLGTIFLFQRVPDKALKYYRASLTYLGEQHFPQETARIYANIGILHAQLKEFAEAERYLLKALRLRPPAEIRLKYLTNLAGIYLDEKKKGRALETFEEALDLAKSLSDESIEATIYTNLSNYYLGERHWEQAEQYARKSLQLRESRKQPPSVVTLNNLGYALVQQNKYLAGIRYYREALPVAGLAEKEQLYHNLYQAHKASRHYEDAFADIEAYNQIRDSLTSLNYKQKIAELNTAYETAQKQQEIQRLAQENAAQKKRLREQAYIMGGLLFIGGLIGGIFYLRWRQFQLTTKLKQVQARHRFLLLQLNPHFIFNSLQSVQSFIYRNDREHSMEYLHHFSRLIRLVLEHSDQDEIPIPQEAELLDHYLQLQQLQQVPSFEYEIRMEGKRDLEDRQIPTMLLQPLVENAVVHGMQNHPHGKIGITFTSTKQGTEIVVKDNGKGIRAVSGGTKGLHQSMSTRILQERITQINKLNRFEIRMSVSSQGEDPEYPGTVVRYTIIHQFSKL